MENLVVYRVTDFSEALAEAFARLLPQLSPRLGALPEAWLRELLASPTTALYVAERAGRIVGTLTLAWYDVPSGRKAWIEDVVVDAAARGCGAGETLVWAAQRHAAQMGVKRVMLTSNPSRTAARALYRKCGFNEAETAVFACNTEAK